MLEVIVELLACPHCRGHLDLVGDRVAGCPNGHRFDVARQGYLNLLARETGHRSDTTEMIMARDRILGGGHYAAITDAVTEVSRASVGEHDHPAVLDVGAGTGHHLSAVLADLPRARGIALDLSVPAVRRAARAHPRLGAVVADTWAGLPVGDHELDLVLAIFAPRNADEFARVLRPDGTLIVVTPAADHLAELRTRLALLDVQEDKSERLDISLSARFRLRRRDRVHGRMRLPPDAVTDLVGMGPNAFHVDLADVSSRARSLGELDIGIAVDVSVYRPTTG